MMNWRSALLIVAAAVITTTAVVTLVYDRKAAAQRATLAECRQSAARIDSARRLMFRSFVDEIGPRRRRIQESCAKSIKDDKAARALGPDGVIAAYGKCLDRIAANMVLVDHDDNRISADGGVQ